MGRELKRVALDFDWPLNKVWDGYLNPYFAEQENCPACGGDGYSPAAQLLNKLWYPRLYAHDVPAFVGRHRQVLPLDLIMFAQQVVARHVPWKDALDQDDVQALVDANRLWDFTRRPRTAEQVAVLQQNGHYWLPEPNGYVPTAEEVNRWSQHGLGHDGINAGVCIEARCQRYGVTATCTACGGTGNVSYPALEAKIDAWTPTEPPAGDGWQVWETASEGSPISPVFATSDGLVTWLEEQGYTRTAAERFIRSAWVPSMVMSVGPEGSTIYRDIDSTLLYTNDGS